MMLQSEAVKYDVAVAPASLVTTDATGRYFDMRQHRRAVVVFSAADMAATNTVICQVREAKDAAGTDAADLTGATATITANSRANIVTLTLATVLNTEAVTINGLVFTAHTNTTTKATRTFSISGDDTADAVELGACINDATYGVPGVTATPAAAVVTLTSTVPGNTTITIGSPAATITPATVEAIGYIELQHGDLDPGFTHVAVKLTSAGTIVTGATLLRSEPVAGTSQAVAASKVQAAA